MRTFKGSKTSVTRRGTYSEVDDVSITIAQLLMDV